MRPAGSGRPCLLWTPTEGAGEGICRVGRGGADTGAVYAMIEPIRGIVGAYDVSCSACGVVERFESPRYGLIIPRMKEKGWRVLAGRHYCPECELPP